MKKGKRRPRYSRKTGAPPALVFCLLSAGLLSAADLRVEGLVSMKEGEVLDLLGDRLIHVRNKPPSATGRVLVL